MKRKNFKTDFKEFDDVVRSVWGLVDYDVFQTNPQAFMKASKKLVKTLEIVATEMKTSDISDRTPEYREEIVKRTRTAIETFRQEILDAIEG